ncbi:MAG: hypothetical protein PUH70_01970 [Clostridiales bacterium]|nr:hypothetical protein [Clostridiales bacterium]MDY5348836.1 hypothetical protein [Candidatus Ventricola sp.]MDY5514191.1 hypothetical protein [Candidatus Ventricola sp.]
MKQMLMRLRAAFTPQAALLLAAALLLLALGGSLTDGGAQEDLESRVERTLSAMEGAGRVQVVIMTRAQQADSSAWGQEDGTAEVPCGAVAVAEGAGDPLVRIELEQALCALLGLPASAVSVVTGTTGGK